MITVIYVRHGATPTTGIELPGRKPGLHLSDKGIKEVEVTAKLLEEACSKDVKIAAIFSSPLERAKETANIISKSIMTKVVVDKRIVECDYGDFTSGKLKVLTKRADWKPLFTWPSGYRFPNGESFNEVSFRLLGFVEHLRSSFKDEVVIAVSHADPIRIAISTALGMGIDGMSKINVATASVSIVSYPNLGEMLPVRVVATNLNKALINYLGVK